MDVRGYASRLVALGVLTAGLLGFSPTALARTDALPTLNVTFSAAGAITFTAPDGSTIGTTSGAPGSLTAGYYTVSLTGPGGCTITPYFELTGPGENIVDNLEQGQEWQDSYTADFLPNSTYTWRSSASPGLVYTFATTSNVVDSAPPVITSSGSFSGSDSHNSDVVGSAVTPFEGSLSGVVSAIGKLTISYRGKPVSKLAAGRYTMTVSDEDVKVGLVVEQVGHAPLHLSAATTSTSLVLTPGNWIFATSARGSSHVVAVSAAS